MTTLVAVLALAAGGVLLVAGLRGVASPAAALGAVALQLAGTGLLWVAVPRPDVAAALAFLLASAAVAAAGRRRRLVGFAALAGLLAAALAVSLAGARGGLGAPRLGEALFSSRHGLLFWNPAAWIGVAGLARLARRERTLAFALAGGLLAAVAVLSGVPAGASGPAAARRFAPLLPLLAPGMAAALDGLAGQAARAPGRLLAAAAALLVAWNLLFMEQYRTGEVPRDSTVSFVAVAENNARLVSRLAGSPLAWPANWAFAARSGLPAERFDLLAGKRLPADAGGAREIDVGELSQDAALLLEGWSVRHPCGAGACRDLAGAARVVAPLERPGAFDLAVQAEGEGVLEASLNGVPLGSRPLTAGGSVVRFPSGERWRRLNVVSLSVAAGGRARVDRIRLEPRGGAS